MPAASISLVDQGQISHDAGRGAYMPSITEADDDQWVAVQHAGSQLGSADNHIELLRSIDSGRTWTQQGSIHGSDHDPRFAFRGPDLSRLPDGRWLITATRFENGDGPLFNPDSEGLQRPELVLFWSEDRGVTWSPPQIVPVDLPRDRYTWNKAGALVTFSPDRWMLPLETWKPEGYAGPPDQKAAAVFSSDQGRTWGELAVIADDSEGKRLWWDQMNALLPDGRLYVMFWTHLYGTKQDLANHWTVSTDQGRTWSDPQPTNLPGQVCSPIALADGRVAAIYNHRQDPQGVRIAISEDLSHFDRAAELVVFDAGAEATFGVTDHENFLAEHLLIAFGKPQGIRLANDDLLTCFWCTVQGVTHTRWVRLRVE